jgi:hypothetical protein
MERYLDAHASSLYHHIEGVWTYHKAVNIGRLRFQVEAHSCDEPIQYSHVVEVCERARYMEIAGKHKIKETQTPVTEHVIEYTSGIGDSCHKLQRHIQILVGNIPELEVPNGMDVTVEQDIIVATDVSVVFGVGYHSWVVATDKDQLLLTCGGPGDGDQLLMMSSRSEVGGIASVLAVIDALVRSGKTKVKAVKLVCDNESSIKACKRKHTQSVFHRTECHHDLISTIHYLQEHWCQDTDVNYEWVKGHADDLNRDPTKLERMNIVADELCDVIRETVSGTFGARPNCGIWPSKMCTLFIRGVKVTINWKERLTQQFLDGDIQEYLIQKEQWLTYSFNNICWKRRQR